MVGLIQSKNQIGVALIIAVGIVLILSACSATGLGRPRPSHSFEIAFVLNDEIRHPPGLGYTVETSWPVLLRAYPDSVIHTVTLNDIETYDWTEQRIMLTRPGSTAFSQRMYDNEVPGLVLAPPFVVVLDGAPLYGGRILFPGSAMGIQFPVIYITETNDQITLAIHPTHGFYRLEPNDPAWGAIKDERIRAVFAEADKLAK